MDGPLRQIPKKLTKKVSILLKWICVGFVGYGWVSRPLEFPSEENRIRFLVFLEYMNTYQLIEILDEMD